MIHGKQRGEALKNFFERFQGDHQDNDMLESSARHRKRWNGVAMGCGVASLLSLRRGKPCFAGTNVRKIITSCTRVAARILRQIAHFL